MAAPILQIVHELLNPLRVRGILDLHSIEKLVVSLFSLQIENLGLGEESLEVKVLCLLQVRLLNHEFIHDLALVRGSIFGFAAMQVKNSTADFRGDVERGITLDLLKQLEGSPIKRVVRAALEVSQILPFCFRDCARWSKLDLISQRWSSRSGGCLLHLNANIILSKWLSGSRLEERNIWLSLRV